MAGFWNLLSQFFPPKPKFTEKNIPNLSGKVSSYSPEDTSQKLKQLDKQVYIVTGSNTGIGKEVAQILYSKNAKVYIAARSQEKAEKAIEVIKKSSPNSSGELVFLRLDLTNLATIRASAEEFISKETKLDVLFNNAGVWITPQGSKTEQGYELTLGVNDIGPFMFTKLLTPLLVATAKTEPSGAVRVVWVSSVGAELGNHKPGGVPLDNLDYHDEKPGTFRYAVSKAGNYLLAVEYAKRHKTGGVISVPLNPGNLNSDLTRDLGSITRFFFRITLGYPPINGAYTELFAGLSPQVTLQKTGEWSKFCLGIIYCGRIRS
jgi:NAD(P)-dependent dehydrogenase (short-subunit alcohol dehydrogenase family)